VADCGSNLIHRKKLRPSTDGVVWIGERAPDEQRSEFVASTDNWFRPVQFYNAPDGCLWVIDMYRETIEHPWSIPTAIKQQLDLDSGRDRGRLWRLAPDPSPVPRTRTRLTEEGVSNRVALLGHPNGWHRDTAARWLFATGGSEVVEALKGRARLGDRAFPDGPGAAPGRIQLLELLAALGALEDPVRIQALRDPDPGVRGWAYRATAERLGRGDVPDALVDALMARVGVESDPRAALDLALALAAVPGSRRTPALAALLAHPSAWVRSAAIHAAGGDLPVLWTTALKAGENSRPGVDDSTLMELALTMGRAGSPEQIRAALQECVRQQPEARVFALTASLLDGIRRSGREVGRLDVGDDLDPVLQRAVAVVRAGGVAIPPAAIQLVGVLPVEIALPVLIPGLVSSGTSELQEASMATLGRLGGEVWARELATVLGSAPPRLRSPIQALLLSRPEGAMEILRRLDSREWSFDRMDPDVLNRLRAHGNAAVRSRAEAILGEPPPSRQSVVESFIPALSVRGDPSRGQRQFQERCSTCHAFQGQGISLGPDLASVVSNGKEKLLVSILDPNREVAPNFAAWSVESADGQTLSGILVRQGEDTVTVRQAGGVESTFKTSSLRELRPEGRSLMPEGLEAGWSSQDLADLLEYLAPW
jgi:putative heme-binding domain-containing protein